MLSRVVAVLSALADRRTRLRRNLEDVFDREVLGSVMVTASLMKVIEKVLTREPALLVGWVAVFVAALWLFVKWDRVAEAADAAVEGAADAAEKVADE